MAASDLDTELRRRAEASARSILSDAQEEADRLASEAELLVAARRKDVLREKETTYGAEARVTIAAERHAAMRAVLLARTRVVDRVLERARALLPEAAKRKTYTSGLSAELAKALQFVETEGAIVRCSVDLAPMLREALVRWPEVTLEPGADLATGFIVIGGEGSVLVDARLDARIDQLASALGIEILAQLGEA